MKTLSPLRQRDRAVGAKMERQAIILQIRQTAHRLLIEAMQHDQYDLERAEFIVTILEELVADLENA